MGIFNNIKNKFFSNDNKKILNETNVNEYDDPLLKALLNNENITKEKAMSVPTVASNVDLLSSMIACMPILLKKDSGGKVEEKRNDYRLRLLNDETNDTLTSFQWKKAMIEDYLITKGGYTYIKWNRNKINGLYYVSSEYVGISRNSDPIYKKCEFNIKSKTYKDYEIMRILRNTHNGASGTPLIDDISKCIETAFQNLIYQYNLLKKGGNKKGFLTSENRLTQEAIDNLKTAWRRMYVDNEENCIVLNKGIKFEGSSNSSVEMQLNENNKSLIEQINNVFHISNNFEETFKLAIFPIVKEFENSLNKFLLLESEKKQGYFFEIDTKEITKANIKERYEAYNLALSGGWKNKNEIRYEENLDEIDGLDAFNMSLGSVLFDPKTQTYFVPNTGQIKENNEENKEITQENEQIEEKN